MGKYLQYLRFEIKLSKEQKTFSENQKNASKSCNLIEELYNLYLPKKIIIEENICSITVKLSSDEEFEGKVVTIGWFFDSYIFCDFDNLSSFKILDQKTILLDLFLKGINQCCTYENPNFVAFKEIYNKILVDKIVFNDFYKGRKLNPNKTLSAQMKGYYCENFEDRKFFVTIFSKEEKELKSIFIGNYNFQIFDRIKWSDNKTIFAYHINGIQSYKRKKIAEDYYEIDTENETVTYNPVTRESMFNFGVKLLTETNEFEKAMEYLLQVRQLGHGKVENILRNLEINPHERDKLRLLQTPKRK